MEKLIITVALTGNVPTRDLNSNLPVTPEEIARDVARCAEAGASLFHVHARDGQGRPTLDLEVFKEIARRIKDLAPEVIIQLSTGGRAGSDHRQRMAPVLLRPEMASFTTGSCNLPGIVYENSPAFLKDLARAFLEHGVKPEIEVFEPGMINNCLFLHQKGLLSPPFHFDFVLGAPGALPASVKNLLFLVESIPPGSTWSVAGIGSQEMPMAMAALTMGGHVRVGLEDNLFLPDGTPASNLSLVNWVVKAARLLGRAIATPDEAREILGLDHANKDRIMERI